MRTGFSSLIIGLDWLILDWLALDWAELDGAGFDDAELDESELDSATLDTAELEAMELLIDALDKELDDVEATLLNIELKLLLANDDVELDISGAPLGELEPPLHPISEIP